MLLLGHDRLVDALLAHVSSSLMVSIDADERVLSADLLLAQLANIIDWVVTGVLGKSERDFFESVGKSAHCVLLDTTDLVSLLRNSDGASELSGTTATDNVGILDHVTDDTDGVVKATLGFITDRLGATTDHYRHGLRVLTVFDENNFVTRRAVANLFDATGSAEFLGSDLLEAGNDARARRDGEKLDLDTTNPTHGGKLVLHEQVVGLVVEAPLAENGSGARIFNALHHIGEVVLLHLLKFLVVSGALDLKAVLGLGLRGLERAREDADLGVLNLLEHLGVGELLVKNDALNEAGVFDGATSLGDDLDEVEVDVMTLEVSNVENGLQGEVSVVLLARADDLGAKGGLSALSQFGMIILEDVKLLLDLVDLFHGNVASGLETIRNFERVDALIQKFLGLLEDGTGEHNDTSGAIADLIVLRGGKLGQKPSSLMMDLLTQYNQHKLFGAPKRI